VKTIHAVNASYTKVVEYFDSYSLAKVMNFWTYSLGDTVKSIPRRFVILRISWRPILYLLVDAKMVVPSSCMVQLFLLQLLGIKVVIQMLIYLTSVLNSAFFMN